MKCSVGRSTFEVDWDGVQDEAEYEHELFCMYDYDTVRVYP